jgi:hypothetical protein
MSEMVMEDEMEESTTMIAGSDCVKPSFPAISAAAASVSFKNYHL